jgi:protein-S-isoprenylcysteine O-methyltransferase Ste14
MGLRWSLGYAVLAYLLAVLTSVYLIAFVGNLGVPKSIDVGATSSLVVSVVIDLALLGLFGLQHSAMARRGFKAWWTRIVAPPAERSTYVLATTLTLMLVMWQWRAIGEPVIWRVVAPAAALAVWAVFALGWALVLLSTFQIDHFELFGLAQPLAALRGLPLRDSPFRTPFLYRYVRHPLYLGFLLAFWATPVMTSGHLLFALGMTVYVGVGIAFEERDLVTHFGDRYRAYRMEVGMILPWRKARRT